ncbi:transcriptional regulator, LysR family protein [Marinomonas sp. MED121]|uniref:LysR substrate-binding domain-containing protein n=1 Tax=Marinomonas sp. MED121 TaxID=314277 RepID=UPI0000691261|nr:LysR substrate-binding domain-containing protein [Marinomonas sp. MED121]EAQ63528.1 transcriptional regulator, LysR family protein [Marinomonas sp. MED121]
MKNIDSDLLRTFVAVYECNGFSSASECLNKTQSTISQRLLKLEDMIGCSLMQRTSRNVKLTPAGKDFLVYARQILKLHAEAIDVAKLAQKNTTLKVGVPDDYAQRFLTPVLRFFRETYPDLIPEVVCETSVRLIEKTMHGELDMALSIKHDNTIPGEFVCNEPLIWAASPDYLVQGREVIPLSVYPEGCIFRSNGIGALAKHSLPWRVAFTSQSPSGISVSVNSGDSVTITSKRLLPDNWRVLTEEEGFPKIKSAELMLYHSPVFDNPFSSCFEEKLLESLGVISPD